MKQIYVKEGFRPKTVKVGFSWTVFFFGPLALAIREQYHEAVLCILLGMLSIGLFWLYLAFTANAKLHEQLLREGWELV